MRRFYVFQSLDNLSFSRCSEYPFEHRGLPTAAPRLDAHGQRTGGYRARSFAGDEVFGDEEVVADHVEELLVAAGGDTWEGNASSPLVAPLNEALANHGTALRVEERGEGSDRRIDLIGYDVEIYVPTTRDTRSICKIRMPERAPGDDWRCRTLEDAVAALIAWHAANGVDVA